METEGARRADLRSFLDQARDALVWKLDGLGEYDARRPVTSTGTNLLGLIKHAANLEMGYLGLVFDRPFPDPPAWFGSVDPLVDMWATDEESRADLLALHPTRPGARRRDHRFRELVDGGVGLRPDRSNLPVDDATFWTEHHDRVERAARAAREREERLDLERWSEIERGS